MLRGVNLITIPFKKCILIVTWLTGSVLACSDLPEVKTITVQIYKESDGKNKKEKRKPVGKKFDFFLSTLTSHFQLKCR